jgi:hypothetical protein
VDNFAGGGVGYPPYDPYPMWKGSPDTDDCGCAGKRDEDMDATAGSAAKSTKARKKKKAVIRTVSERPKKKRTSGSRPWLNH